MTYIRRRFPTSDAAYAFLAGVNFVNDSAVRGITVLHEPDGYHAIVEDDDFEEDPTDTEALAETTPPPAHICHEEE